MKNLQQFSAKVQYVTPSCRSVELRSRQTILTGSNWGEPGKAGGQGGFIDDTGEDY